MTEKRIIIAMAVALSMTLVGCGSRSYLQAAEETTEETAVGDETVDTDTAEGASGEAAAGQIVVQVAGAVHSPGVFTLEEGSRVADAIAAAGGLTEDADDTDLNLARILEDEQKITVYTAAEAEATAQAQTAAAQAAAAGVDAEGRIDINTASKEQLMTLSGVGESRADAIIDYRETNGPFTDISQIMNISGIKEGLYAKIEDSITVG